LNEIKNKAKELIDKQEDIENKINETSINDNKDKYSDVSTRKKLLQKNIKMINEMLSQIESILESINKQIYL
jgi:F0F1-type ATP synthase beta subunit